MDLQRPDLRVTIDERLGPRQGGTDLRPAWCCPFHNDTNPSFGIIPDSQPERWKCFGCDASGDVFDFIAKSDGRELKDVLREYRENGGRRNAVDVAKPKASVHADDQPASTDPEPPCTVENLAAAKGLDPDTLRAFGVKDGTRGGRPCVEIPYRGPDGSLAATRFRQRFQKDPTKKVPRFDWIRGSKTMLYGLERLAEARKAGFLWLVEGESDAWTCWKNGIPALGVPGATNWKNEWSVHMDGIARVFVLQEPDAAGEGLARKLSSSPIADRVFVMAPGMDVNDLWLSGKDPDAFGDRARHLMRAATDRGPARGLQLVRASSLTPAPVQWFWKGRVPSGMLSIFSGDPDLGKSLVALDLAARASSGRPMPDTPDVPSPAGDVLLFSAEDDSARTIVPRLIAAGGDLDRVFIDTGISETDGKTGEKRVRPFTLADVAQLDSKLAQVKARLVVIDPLKSFTGGVDTRDDAQMRSVLDGLSRVAAKYDVAVLIVDHLNKRTDVKAKYRTGGAIAIVAVARSNWLIALHPDDDKEEIPIADARRVLVRVKANLTSESRGLEFKIGTLPVPMDELVHELPVVEWGAATTLRGDDVVGPEDRDDRGRLGEAKTWLLSKLANGPVERQALQGEAKRDGLAWRTLERAASVLGIVKEPGGFGKPWEWNLPPAEESTPLPQDLADTGKVGGDWQETRQNGDLTMAESAPVSAKLADSVAPVSAKSTSVRQGMADSVTLQNDDSKHSDQESANFSSVSQALRSRGDFLPAGEDLP